MAEKKERVTGIGGVFFKAENRDELMDWYREHLGIEPEFTGGTSFKWLELEEPHREGSTVWSLFPKETKYFDPGTAPFMINYRVKDLRAMVEQLRSEGVEVTDAKDDPYGLFAWVMDSEGNRLELWQPIDAED